MATRGTRAYGSRGCAALRGSIAYGFFRPCFDGLARVTHTQPSSASLATCILETSGFVRLHVQKAVTLFDFAYETKTGHRDLLYYQPVVEVARRTESGAGPVGQGEKRENTGSI